MAAVQVEAPNQHAIIYGRVQPRFINYANKAPCKSRAHPSLSVLKFLLGLFCPSFLLATNHCTQVFKTPSPDPKFAYLSEPFEPAPLLSHRSCPAALTRRLPLPLLPHGQPFEPAPLLSRVFIKVSILSTPQKGSIVGGAWDTFLYYALWRAIDEYTSRLLPSILRHNLPAYYLSWASFQLDHLRWKAEPLPGRAEISTVIWKSGFHSLVLTFTSAVSNLIIKNVSLTKKNYMCKNERKL